MPAKRGISEWRNAAAAEALDYCEKSKITQNVEQCLTLADKNMNVIDIPAIHLVTDEETRETSLMIIVTASGSAEEASAAYERFNRDWTDATRGRKLDNILLSYTVA